MAAFGFCCLSALFLPSAAVAVAIPVNHGRRSDVIFTHQSQLLSLDDWLTMLTLCVAPLAMHMAFGRTEPILVPPKTSSPEDHPMKRPPMTERMTLFNPISILWRYHAIMDRRVRAIDWDRKDMAACNALFWGKDGWDGSERMMLRSRPFTIESKLPPKTHIRVVSVSSVISLVMALQGIQAANIVILYLRRVHPYPRGLPGVFAGLAILSLFRLPPAMWLSNDFEYDFDAESSKGRDIPLEAGHDRRERLTAPKSWQGTVYRAWWLLSVSALAGLGLRSASLLDTESLSVTSLLERVLYAAISGSAFFIHVWYVLTGQTRTTIIPCIQSVWYKIHTLVLLLLSLACAVFAGLETRMMENGKYTTCPKGINSIISC